MADQKGNQQKPGASAPVKLSPEQLQAKRVALFRELAPKRTREILKRIEVLGNCSNRVGYSYTDEQIAKIFSTIEKKLAETKQLFSASAKQGNIQFTLD